MERLERFYKIDQLLKERQAVSFSALQSSLGVSAATLKRDLEYMRERFNAPIEYDREANGYRFGAPRAGPRYELPGLWSSVDEAYALLSMHALLAELQPGLLEPHVAPLQARLRAVLGGEPAWKDIEKRIRVFQPERRISKEEFFGVVATAVLRRARLWIRHYNRKDHRETEREISPQRLVHYLGNWYVDAYCHVREGPRSFAVDAIRAAELREARAKEVHTAELDAHLGSGYGIFSGSEVQWAKLRFTPQAARWVSAQSWHPKQRARFDDDGSLFAIRPLYGELAAESMNHCDAKHYSRARNTPKTPGTSWHRREGISYPQAECELEALCARLAAQRMSVVEKKQLEHVHQASEEYVGRGDDTGYLALNQQFHDLICAGTHNHRADGARAARPARAVPASPVGRRAPPRRVARGAHGDRARDCRLGPRCRLRGDAQSQRATEHARARADAQRARPDRAAAAGFAPDRTLRQARPS